MRFAWIMFIKIKDDNGKQVGGYWKIQIGMEKKPGLPFLGVGLIFNGDLMN